MTDFLLKLLGASMDDAVSINHASLAFRGVGLGWFLFYLLLLAALIYWMYSKGPGNISRVRHYTLTALRIVLVCLVLLLLLRPVLALTVEGSVRRMLVLLMDTSASMQMKDNRLQVEDQNRAALATGLLDAQKGLHQGLDRNKATSVQQLARIDVV